MGIFKPARDLILTRLSSFPEFDPNPVLEIDLVGKVTYINPLGKRLFPELESQALSHPYLAEIGEIADLLRKKGSISHERELQVGDHWFKQVFFLVRNENRMRIYGTNISDLKKREDILKTRLSLSDYATAHTEDELLQETLDEAERLTGSVIGFFHYVDEDQLNLKLQMWSTNTIRNICSAEGKGSHYPIDRAGVWVDSFHVKRPVIHNDYAALPHKKGLPEGHAPVSRELVVPVIQNDKVVAILGVGNKPTDYDEVDVETASAFAHMVWDVVMRKKAEAALAESERKYRTLYKTLRDGFVYVDSEGRIKEYNEIYREMLGYSDDEIIGLSYLDITPQQWHAFEKKIVEEQILQRGFSEVYEKEYRRKDGTVFPVELRAYLITNEQGAHEGMWAIVRDITKRRDAEAERERLITELRAASDQIKALKGMLPICSYCKKIRDDKGYWEEVSSYISRHSDALFSHGICPECEKKVYDSLDEGKSPAPEDGRTGQE